MAMELLSRIARSRLPLTLNEPEDVDGVRLLRAAGLVIALVPAPSDPLMLSGKATGAQVLAITQKGLEELASVRMSYPERKDPAPGWRAWMPRLRPGRHRSAEPRPGA